MPVEQPGANVDYEKLREQYADQKREEQEEEEGDLIQVTLSLPDGSTRALTVCNWRCVLRASLPALQLLVCSPHARFDAACKASRRTICQDPSLAKAAHDMSANTCCRSKLAIK